jgi:hypothetical protein
MLFPQTGHVSLTKNGMIYTTQMVLLAQSNKRSYDELDIKRG